VYAFQLTLEFSFAENREVSLSVSISSNRTQVANLSVTNFTVVTPPLNLNSNASWSLSYASSTARVMTLAQSCVSSASILAWVIRPLICSLPRFPNAYNANLPLL
jgi:hypothetical protein